MPITMPAEWARQSAVLLSWPHSDTDWAYMLDDVKRCFRHIAEAVIDGGEKLIIVAPDIDEVKYDLEGVDISNTLFLPMPTNDTWARDFGAITIVDDGCLKLCNFKFNAWGLKFAADKDNLITSRMAKAGAFAVPVVNCLNFVLEGGSIESDGCGTILTTSECLLSENRNGEFSRHQIEDCLAQRLGAQRVLWLDNGALLGDDTDSHIDTLARFVDPHTIAYVKCYDPADDHFAELEAMERQLQAMTDVDGNRYRLVPLPLPRPIHDEDGLRLPATYANFLIMNSRVLVPVYADEVNDARALETLAGCFPGREIVPIDCRALIQQHGSLHCVTMQFPEGVIN